MMDDGLQLLKVHLDASVPCHQNQILPPTVCALAVETVLSGRRPGPDGRRKVIAHGRNSGIGDKSLPFFDHISMAPYHAGRAISHYGDLVFL